MEQPISGTSLLYWPRAGTATHWPGKAACCQQRCQPGRWSAGAQASTISKWRQPEGESAILDMVVIRTGFLVRLRDSFESTLHPSVAGRHPNCQCSGDAVNAESAAVANGGRIGPAGYHLTGASRRGRLRRSSELPRTRPSIHAASAGGNASEHQEHSRLGRVHSPRGASSPGLQSAGQTAPRGSPTRRCMPGQGIRGKARRMRSRP